MEIRIFLKNFALSLFYSHENLTPCKKLKESDEQFLSWLSYITNDNKLDDQNIKFKIIVLSK